MVLPLEIRFPFPYGEASLDPDTPFVDPLISIGFAAANTNTLRLGTGGNILPQATLYLAKQIASLDVLSGGRVIVGVGAGWLREEYDALGVPFNTRDRRFDDYLDALKKVWSGETVEHQSDFISWSGFKSYPLPIQKPHPPLLIGGESPAAVRRVLTHGDGWFTASMGLDSVKDGISRLRRTAEELGRDASHVEVSAMWPLANEGLDSLEQYEEIGVSRLVVPVEAVGGEDPLVGWRSSGRLWLACEALRQLNGPKLYLDQVLAKKEILKA